MRLVGTKYKFSENHRKSVKKKVKKKYFIKTKKKWTCSGAQQSPINIETSIAKVNIALAPINFNYYDQIVKLNITNNGHTSTLCSSIYLSWFDWIIIYNI